MTEKEFYKEVTKDMVVDLKGRDWNMEKKNKRIRFSRIAAAFLIGVLGISGVGFSAYAYHKWTGGVQQLFHVSPKDTAQIEKTKVAQFPQEDGEVKSVTQDGVTMTAEQTLVDNNYAYLVFKVKGYEIKAGDTPGFKSFQCSLDGNKVSNCSKFYDGTINDGNGRGIMPDGSEIPKDKDGSLICNYVMEDGSLEYHVLLYTNGEKGCFFNQPFHAEFKDLGLYGTKKAITVQKKGTWTFDWKLSGDHTSVCKKMNTALGEKGLTVMECEVSPISLRAVIAFPDTIKRGMDGLEIPALSGVKLKDGTLLTCITSGGSEGWDENGNCEVSYALERIVDPDEVESLLFVKSSWEDSGSCTLDNFYQIPFK